jgi:glycosyltransferase involved in cell wall biosynthesis
MSAYSDPRLGIVVIGRNEGERLRRCLQSLASFAARTVYVDSGSTDDSVAMAESLGVAVVRLDARIPFTAAKARNAGWRHLSMLWPEVSYVQFVDGDCEVADEWLPIGVAFLDGRPDVAAVCGRRREKFPHRSIYNLLCDFEWATPVGEARACGGDALMRLQALQRVGGFKDDLIAGEEPELCVRLRAAGWRVWRLDCEMTRHDAAMTHFRQWWRRSVRAGHAFAEGAYLHGRSQERHYVRESCRAWMWGALLPATLLSLSLLHPAGWLLALAYPLQVVKIAVRDSSPEPERWRLALLLVVGKFAEVQGQVDFLVHHLSKRKTPLMEYK